MKIVISIAYVALILAAFMVRRSLKLRSHQSMRNLNVRSGERIDHRH
jgi:hypothetical protein